MLKKGNAEPTATSKERNVGTQLQVTSAVGYYTLSIRLLVLITQLRVESILLVCMLLYVLTVYRTQENCTTLLFFLPFFK
jgi:hypothetical protein